MIAAISQPRERKVNNGGIDAKSNTCSISCNAHNEPLHSMTNKTHFNERHVSKGKYQLSWRSRLRIVGHQISSRMRTLCGHHNSCGSKANYPMTNFLLVFFILAPLYYTLRWHVMNEKNARIERSRIIAERMGWNRRPMLVKCCADGDDDFSAVTGASLSSSLAYRNNLSIRQYSKTLKSMDSISLDFNDSTLQQSSEDYGRKGVPQFVTDTCKEQYDWQLETHSNCNSIHEFGLGHPNDEVELINGGFWRDVWRVSDVSGVKQVLKTLRYNHGFTGRNYDRHRKDALSMERLSSSKFVVDIYGFCGNSGVFEHTNRGGLDDLIWSRKGKLLKPVEKLVIALDAARGLADTHNVDMEGQASIAHTDISPGQFLLIDGVFKLNDFNRARFMRWDTNANKTCGYKVSMNPGTFRSPEEYAYEVQDEKVDVYSLGNVYYCLLTRLWPFETIKTREAIKKVKSGERPPLPDDIRTSTDASIVAIRDAMEKAYIQNPDDRASAREIVNDLSAALEKVQASLE